MLKDKVLPFKIENKVEGSQCNILSLPALCNCGQCHELWCQVD